MNPMWIRIWNETGPTLTPRRELDTDIPRLQFGQSFGDGYCRLSSDGTHLVFPIFFGFGNTPSVTSIPLPEILDIVFFEKMAAFLVKIKFKLRGLVAQMGPVTWDSTGFLENIIIENREHIAHVNGFNELIIDRMCEYLDVVLNDWNGDSLDGRVSHATFFFDKTINEELLDELVARQTPLGQAFELFD